jgi:integrase
LPAARSKNGRPLVTPLPEAALRIIEAQPKNGLFVFSVFGLKPLTGFSKAKLRLDRLSGVTGWRCHDCRRTFVTGCNELGVRSEIVEKLVNHTSGRSVIAGVYDRSSSMAERKIALQRWASHVEGLVSGNGNVIRLRA